MAGDVRVRRGGPSGRGEREQPPPVPRLVGGQPFAGQHRVQPGGDVAVVVEAQDLRLGQRLGQLRSVPFSQAAHGHDPGAAGRGAEQFGDGFLLRRLDEATRVDEDDLRLTPVLVAGQRPAGRVEPPGEFLGVDLVARAAQGHQVDGPFPRPRVLHARRHTGRLR